MVQLPVLRTQERLVVAADPVDRRAHEYAEIHRLGRPRLATGMEPGRAHAHLGRHRPGHGLLERGDARSGHDAADIVGGRRGQRLRGNPQVAGWQQGMAIHPRHDRVV